MLKLTPSGWCVNPVFELHNALPKLKAATLDGRTLDPGRYAWDGHKLWIDLKFERPVTIGLEFEKAVSG